MNRNPAPAVKSLLNWSGLLGLLILPQVSILEAHFLFRIDGDTPSYVYGTVHSSDALVSEIPAPVREALAASATFHPELEFSPENLGRLTSAIFGGGESDLEKELPPELWERLAEAGGRAGLPRVLLRRVPLQLAPLLFATPPDADFNRIVDIQVYQLAQDNGLAVHQLETADEQLNVFLDLPRNASLEFLRQTLDEFERGFPTLKKTLRMYAAGDLEGLEEFLQEEFERFDFPEIEEILLTRRNRLMARRLQPFLKEGGAFIAVGIGHLPGEEGLLALLEQEGFRPVRVKLPRKASPAKQGK